MKQMTQAKILSWLEGKPQIGQDTEAEAEALGPTFPEEGVCRGRLNRVGRVRALCG